MTKRKTAAEKRAEAEALRREQEAREEATFNAEYHSRLLKLLHMYVREMPTRFFAMKFGEEKQAFKFFCSDHDHVVVLPLEMNGCDFRSLEYNFETAERYVQDALEERKEAELREMKRRAALSKLTEEERELLGL